ncbi:MAG TPA: antibiotic biosynthesis monooxygenase [Pyrinomonadaceae bacterium]|nr:antibiotic biosynthesis monooxygenase [Pyrinomonadaceae bacterium]
MIEVVWEFIVKSERVDEFVDAYGPVGAWSALFSEFEGYRGTRLYSDVDRPNRFLTIDVWDSAAARERMFELAGERYARLDREFEGLTESEREIGVFEPQK